MHISLRSLRFAVDICQKQYMRLSLVDNTIAMVAQLKLIFLFSSNMFCYFYG